MTIDKKYFYFSLERYPFTNWKTIEFTMGFGIFPFDFHFSFYFLKIGINIVIGRYDL